MISSSSELRFASRFWSSSTDFLPDTVFLLRCALDVHALLLVEHEHSSCMPLVDHELALISCRRHRNREQL
ncbi:hypothetical protein M5689_012652 [Euphorbia peplus]|nr:hypothetical protein M5689_012652 [Euphorbia peplus]